MFLRFTSYNLYIIKETYLNQACKISTLNSIASDFILKMNMPLACYFPANICWSSRRLQDMSWRRLQHVFSVTILRLPRRLEDVLEDEKLLRWRRLEDVLKTYLEDVLKTSWRQTKCLLRISVSNKPKCVSNKSIFHKSISDKSKVNPKCKSNSSQSLMTVWCCEISWIQIRHC